MTANTVRQRHRGHGFLANTPYFRPWSQKRMFADGSVWSVERQYASPRS